MFFKTVLVSAFAALFVGQAVGIATDAYAACNCPNNCSHENESNCKFYSGASDKSDVVKGKCTTRRGDDLICIPSA